jgi:hypothetical protein
MALAALFRQRPRPPLDRLGNTVAFSDGVDYQAGFAAITDGVNLGDFTFQGFYQSGIRFKR